MTDKLKALGVKVGAQDLAARKKAGAYAIESVVEGSYKQTIDGDVFVSEQVFPADYKHGTTPLGIPVHREVLAAWLEDTRIIDLPIESFIFLDIETSGLAGGTGTYAFMVGVGRFTRKTGKEIRSSEESLIFELKLFFMRDPSEEFALLIALDEYFSEGDALVTFNGKSFDAPLLATRFRMHSMQVPFHDYIHLDLLHLSRRLWRDRLPSRTLKYLEEVILEAPRSSEEVPGYEIPYLYFDYLRTGDARPLAGVFYHNAMDVLAMGALLNHIGSILTDPFSGCVEHGLDYVALARLYESLGEWDAAVRLYEQGLEMGIEDEGLWAAVRRLSILQRRRGEVQNATALWERAAANGQIYAHIELAKYYEHHCKDHAAALLWTEQAVEAITAQDLPKHLLKRLKVELTHRKKRLKGKLKTKA